MFSLFGGWTGIIITLSLITIVTSAAEPIRRSFFEIFWLTHHLFVIFFVFLIIHGYGKQIRGQTNISEHSPSYCYNQTELWDEIAECPLPQFGGSSPATWKWVIGPFAVYLIERLIRVYHSVFPGNLINDHCTLMKIV